MDRTLQQSESFTCHIAHSWFFPLSYSDWTVVEEQFVISWYRLVGKIESQWSRIQISYQAVPNSNLWWNFYACSLFPWYLTKQNKKHGNQVKSEFASGEHPPTKSPLSPRKKKTPCSSMDHCHPVIVQQLQLHFFDHLPSVSASPVPLGSATWY